MSYVKKIYTFKNAIEIEEYHTARYGAPGMPRQKRDRPTPEQIERQNQRNKEKRCRRKLRTHFEVNDYLVTLTYEKNKRPADMEEAKKDLGRFLRKVRQAYAKKGRTVKWIRNIEVGTKGAWHVHIVLNRIEDTDVIIREAWVKGRVVQQLLYDKGEFADLAAYITKTPMTDPRLREASYSTSRNLPIREPKTTFYVRWRTWANEPKIPAGWYLDKDSLREGIDPVRGYGFRSYTMLRVKRE